MPKVLLALIFATVIAMPAPAQDYHKNFRECAKEFGLNPDLAYTHKFKRRPAAACCADGVPTARLSKWRFMIVSAGKRDSHLNHPPMSLRELHTEHLVSPRHGMATRQRHLQAEASGWAGRQQREVRAISKEPDGAWMQLNRAELQIHQLGCSNAASTSTRSI